MVSFARRLREMRQAAGMTQQQLADLVNTAGHKIHRSAIAKIEAGDRPVSLDEAMQIAGVFSIGLAELMSERMVITDPNADLKIAISVAMNRVHRAWERFDRECGEAADELAAAIEQARQVRTGAT